MPQIASLLEVYGIEETDSWKELRRVFFELKHELETHMLKEEYTLFPSILHMEFAATQGQKPNLSKHDLRNPLDQAEMEHDASHHFLLQIDELRSQIGTSSKTEELFRRLENLKQDLIVHMQKEEKDLFPEARRIYAKLTENMLREE